ncbi:Hypothetical protein RADP37_03985 [Roseomonas mucosa]|uniref:Uncharacterized protein n=1 Tax=Roseomonas mucosa TaxID=207340 RepID=A0A4Y1MVC8_9PROT|nr:Hypothetical protein RADP37_03985 [Roseomonas mucosa]
MGPGPDELAPAEPDRAGKHGSPAGCWCRQRGQGVFLLFGSPASPPVPRDQPAG